MAGMKPFFLTGANAKIKINGLTLAYCTNLSYSVNVNHATPRVLGMYEASSVEPLSYIVTGTFSVIRYIADSQENISGTNPQGTRNSGNGIGTWSDKKGQIWSGSDARTDESLSPGKLDRSSMFEINVYQKTCNGGQQSVAKIRDARITKADFTLSKNAPAMQTFQFTAIYADEDSFLAATSGSGQQFS